MSVSKEEKQEFWKKAYLAAIAGVASNAARIDNKEMCRIAVLVADESVAAYATKIPNVR